MEKMIPTNNGVKIMDSRNTPMAPTRVRRPTIASNAQKNT
jgi:hypothetical protein